MTNNATATFDFMTGTGDHSKPDSAQGALVSVVVGVYNGARFLRETLNMILAQSHYNLEVIVVDDCSTDTSAAIVESLIAADPRVRLIRLAQNSGVACARNRGIHAAVGDYVAPCDADDLWYPTKIERQVAVAESSPRVGLVYCWTAHVDETGAFTGEVRAKTASGSVFRQMLHDDLIGSGSIPLFRRACLEELGGYDESLSNLEDHDLCLRIAESWDIGVTPEILVKYRQVRGSKSRNSTGMVASYRKVYERVKAMHPEIPKRELEYYKAVHLWWFASLDLQMDDYRTSLRHLLLALELSPKLCLRAKTYRYLVLSLAGCFAGATICNWVRGRLREIATTYRCARRQSPKPSKLLSGTGRT